MWIHCGCQMLIWRPTQDCCHVPNTMLYSHFTWKGHTLALISISSHFYLPFLVGTQCQPYNMMLASVGNHVIEGCWSVSKTCQHMCVMADLVKFVMVCVVTVNLGEPLAVDPTLSVLHLMILEWGFDDGWMLWMEYCYVYPPTTCDC